MAVVCIATSAKTGMGVLPSTPMFASLFVSSRPRPSKTQEKVRKNVLRTAALTISASISLLPWSKYPRTGQMLKSVYASNPLTSTHSCSHPSRSFPGSRRDTRE